MHDLQDCKILKAHAFFTLRLPCGGALLEKIPGLQPYTLLTFLQEEESSSAWQAWKGSPKWAPLSFPSHPEEQLSGVGSTTFPPLHFTQSGAQMGWQLLFISAHDFVDRINLHMK